MFNLNVFRKKKEMKVEIEVQGIRPSFHSKCFGPNNFSFSYTPHAKEVLRCNIPEEGKGSERGQRHEEKKVKANGTRGRGKGATE